VSLEGQLLDQKSLRAVSGKTANWDEIAKDCIAFANATGGRLLLGIEDGQDEPPAGQLIPTDLPDILLRSLQFTGETTLKRIEPRRLAALVLEDLQRYPRSAISDIHQRVGGEIHPKQVKRALEELIERGEVRFEGNKRWRRYWALA
jgi:predicted HTH transcriptional regulator